MVLFAVKLQTTVEVFVSDSVLQNTYKNSCYYYLKNPQKTCNVFSAYLLHEAACHVVRCRAPTLIFESLSSFLPLSLSKEWTDWKEGVIERWSFLFFLNRQLTDLSSLLSPWFMCLESSKMTWAFSARQTKCKFICLFSLCTLEGLLAWQLKLIQETSRGLF